MTGLFTVVILQTIITACEPLSIDRMMLKALEHNETSDGKTEFSDFPWNDFKLPELENQTETYIKLEIDMILPLEEAEAIYTHLNFRGRRKRSALRDTTKLWTSRRIPYEIHDLFSDEEKLIILGALQQWMQFTCLEFVPRQEKDFSFIKFKSDKTRGCLSFVGKKNIFGQPIYLAPNCVYTNIVIHEIGHTLGLLHEQSRPDRDEYVTINEDNIQKGMKHNFDKGNWTHMSNYSKPYDYNSIMHYSKDVFSKNWKEGLLTMIPKNSSYTDIIGDGKTLSFLDAKIINTMYKCSSGCASKVCPHNGYLGKNCECYCPNGDGPDPVMLCTQQMYCKNPELDQSVFVLYDDSREGYPINNPDKDYLNGTRVNIDFLDMDRCGWETGSLVCVNGSWSGKLPKCDYNSCSLPTTWNNREGVPPKDDTLFHKTNISVACPRNVRKVFLLTCNNGTFLEEGTTTVFNTSVSPCGKSRYSGIPVTPTYRVIKDDGKPCTVAYNPKVKYTIRQDSIVLGPGELIFHMAQVTATCDDPDVKNEFETEDLERLMFCKDGNWDGEPPQKCPSVRKPCGLITNAVVKGPLPHSSKNKDELMEQLFSVACEPGYTQIAPTSNFTCTFDGEWKTETPYCEPNWCIVPQSYSDSLVDEDNNRVNAGTNVQHGQTVNLQCPRGHVSDATTSTCNLGEWSTGNLPVCRKVVCKTRKTYPIYKRHYTTFKYEAEYVYGDSITVERCRGSLEFKGPNTITCERTGKWSNRIVCKKFCKDGKSKFRQWNGKNMLAKVKEEVDFGNFSPEACMEECASRRSYLCRAVSYGWVVGKGLMCYLYDEKIEDEFISLKDDQSWEVQERICIENNKL